MTTSAVGKLAAEWRDRSSQLSKSAADAAVVDARMTFAAGASGSGVYITCADELEAALRQGQAGVSALTEERRDLAIRALRHYKTACSRSGSAFADNIDSTIAALATAPPEQAALYHCTYCDGNHNEKDCPQRCVPNPPQAASAGALSAEQVRDLLEPEIADGWEWEAIADRLNAALASHWRTGIDWEAQNKLAQAAEKKDCEKALLALAGWFPTPAETYGFNTSWAISDLCRAVTELRATLAAHDQATLPAKLTLDDIVTALNYASEGRKWAGGGIKPDLLGNQLNRVLARLADEVPIIHSQAELAAHDQKVRAEVLEEAGKHRPVIYILSHDEEALSTKFCCTECSWIGTVEEWEKHIRSLASGAEEK